jgi:hypothetical protein
MSKIRDGIYFLFLSFANFFHFSDENLACEHELNNFFSLIWQNKHLKSTRNYNFKIMTTFRKLCYQNENVSISLFFKSYKKLLHPTITKP